MNLNDKLPENEKDQSVSTAPFQVRRATCSGNGLQHEIEEGNWNQIRFQIYG